MTSPTLGSLGHPPQTFTVVDATHPSTEMLPDRWTFVEEVYNFRSDPRDVGAKVLLSVDESSYTGQWTWNKKRTWSQYSHR